MGVVIHSYGITSASKKFNDPFTFLDYCRSIGAGGVQTSLGVRDRAIVSDYLDSVRACYPQKAIMVTEFGAEANRDGPVEEKGTFQFQQDFVNYHLGIFATKPWLSGAIYWAIEEFRVRPGWDGGNPRPDPPIHEKGLLRFADRSKKPAWFDVNRWYTQTQQIGPVPGQ